MVAPVGDAGWNFMHNEGRLGAESATASRPHSSKLCPKVAPNLMKLCSSSSMMASTSSSPHRLATWTQPRSRRRQPDVIFEHISGFRKNDTNFGNSFGRMYQPRYIAGMAAGAATESNTIGYVAAFPIPEVIRGINAFALGVKAVNPDATVEVAWTSTWFGIAEEGAAAQAPYRLRC